MSVQLFCGYDHREAVGYHTFCASVIKRASKPVTFRPLAAMGLPEGSNAFSLSRFLVPWLMNFKGHAIFADSVDMLCLADIAELDALFDPKYAIQVVKHPDYISTHARKYVGTEMECFQSQYGRKNWASLAIVNCSHAAWFGLTPQAVGIKSPLQLLQFQDLLDDEIGDLPADWNVLVDEGQKHETAKILHWSNGAPFFKHYQNQNRSQDWFAEYQAIGSRQDG